MTASVICLLTCHDRVKDIYLHFACWCFQSPSLLAIILVMTVVFIYYHGGKKVEKSLTGTPKSSREGLGVWHVEKWAWKVYRVDPEDDKKKKKKTMKDVSDDYHRAEAAGLPIGRYSFIKGQVRADNKLTHGFVLQTEWMGDWHSFNPQKHIALKKALKGAKISQDEHSEDYKRIKGGCLSAQAVGLNDPQGFVHTSTDPHKPIREPIRFIDVHTSWNNITKKFRSSAAADALVKEIEDWAEKPKH